MYPTILTALICAFTLTLSPTAAHAADPEPVEIIAAGDIAPDPAETERGDFATAALVQRHQPRLVLGLGDMQYNYGDYAAFTSPRGYEGSWGQFKAITRPAPGNHDYGQTRRTGGAGYYRYFGALAGPAGKGWYSYNVGTWHVIALNSTCGFEGGPSCARTSEQVRWLQHDLAAHRNKCVLAYWHHPRFTGYAKANTSGEALRTRYFTNALYAAKADVVLTGHLHSYERTTGLTATGKTSTTRGIRHFIVGTGGEDPSKATPAAPGRRAAVNNRYGVLRLQLGDGWWKSSFLTTRGETLDRAGASCIR